MATLNNFTITSPQNQDILIYSNGSWINSNINGFFGILDGRYSANTHNHDGRYILKAGAYTKSQTYPAASLYTKAEIDAMFSGFDPGTGGGGSGLVNSASNVGSGAGVFHANSSGDLQFRSLFSQDIDLLTIAVSGTSIIFTPNTPTWSRLVSDNGQLTTAHVNFANQGLNTSSQPSFSGLTINTGSWSTGGLKLTGAAPSIYFSQDDSTNAFLGINGDIFYLLPDVDSNGSYESPYTLAIGISSNSFTYRGNAIYHAGNKPTYSELGTITTSHVNFANQGLNTGSDVTFNSLNTSYYMEVGRGSGSVAMTINDGYGNANLTFNHRGGTPDYSGNSARIEVNTDSTSDASFSFEVGSGVTAGQAVALNQVMFLSETAFKYKSYNVYHEGYKPSKSDVGLSLVQNISFNWSWGSSAPTHIWGSSGNSQQSYVYTPNDVRDAMDIRWSDIQNKPDVPVVSYAVSRSVLSNSSTLDSGFYTTSEGLPNADNSGVEESSWWHVLNFKHGDNNGFGSQLAIELSSATDAQLQFRTSQGSSGGDSWTGWYKVYSEQHKPTWNDVTGKPSTFPPSAHTHSYSEVNFVGSFDINGTGPGAQDSGIYVSSVTAQGATLNPAYTAILSAQTSSSRSIHLTVDSDGYLHGMRSHSNAGTYTFDSKTKYSDEASLVRSIGTATVPSSRNTLRDGLFHYGTIEASNNPPHSSNYGESIVWGSGTGGSIELWGGWTSGGWGRLYTRALRDTGDNWSSWYEVYTSREPRLREVFKNGYAGMGTSGGSDSSWIRTTSNGIIPYQSGGSSSLGTSIWRFNSTYSNNFYGSYMSLSNRLDIVNGIEVTGINKGIYFNPAGYNDQGGIRYIGTDGNDGAMEFWTNDDYGEPFAFRMYDTGSSGTYREPLRINSAQLVANSEILINHNNGLVVRTTTNGAGAKITFSDNASNGYAQRGFLIYKHSDNAFGIPSGDAFELSGTEPDTKFIVRGEGWADDWVATSDIRVKENLEKIDSSLDKVAKLTGYTYDQVNLKQRKAGLIAQDVKEVLPEAVGEDGEGMLNVSPMAVLALLVNAVNDLSEQVKELKR